VNWRLAPNQSTIAGCWKKNPTVHLPPFKKEQGTANGEWNMVTRWHMMIQFWDKGLTADSDVNACLPNANLHDRLGWVPRSEGKMPAVEKAWSLYSRMQASLEGHHINPQELPFLITHIGDSNDCNKMTTSL
jgi:hypothetical protein